jgi:hypothetical protein
MFGVATTSISIRRTKQVVCADWLEWDKRTQLVAMAA